MSRNKIVLLAALVAILLLPVLAAAQTTTFTLTFEGLQDNEAILNYYNGGLGGSGSGPGPNYGVVFGSGALAIISILDGGSGNVQYNPSGDTVAYFLQGGGLIMNVPAGFSTGFSFYYAAAQQSGSVTVYDGPNGTGNVLATVTLPVTGTDCMGSTEPYSCWSPIGVSFKGVAMSVNFAGADNGIAFDNITIGSQKPNAGVIVNTASLPAGQEGVAYSATVTASGGVPPYHWSATGLPQGLSIDPSSGIISGTPQQTGTFSVTVSATDSDVAAAPQTGTNTYQLMISGPAKPVLSSLAPNTAAAGSGDLTMQVNGTGFLTQSVVQWTPAGGSTSSLTTKIQSPTQLTATVPAALLASAGTAAVTVANGSDLISAPLTFTITPPPAPTLTALSPNTAVAGGSSALTLQVTGTNFNSASVVQWTPAGGSTSTLTTKIQSPTQLTATVPAALLANAGTAAVTVANGSDLISAPLTFTITPPPAPTLTALSPNTAVAGGSSALTLQVTGTNFNSASVVEWTPAGGSETNLATTFQSATSLQATVPATLLATPGTASVMVANSASLVSGPMSFTITAPAVPAGLALAIPTPGVLPTDQPSITVTLSSPALANYTGTVVLSFTPAANVSGWPANQTNAQVVFAGGTNTANFTIAQGATTGTLPNNGMFQQGTVAGTITASITSVNGNALPASSQPTATQTVEALAPVITTGSVKITNLTTTGLTVELDAYSTTRDLSNATFTFQAASGATLSGTSQNVSLSSAATSWFSASGGLAAGGSFHLSVPFTYNGDPNALSGVSVTLTNSVGTSAAATGTN